MDANTLAELGIAAAQIPLVSFIVHPTINQMKAAFNLDGQRTLILAYALSMSLMLVLAVAFDPAMTTPALAPVAIAKALVAGWIAATTAGMAADAQKTTDRKRVARKEFLAITGEPD